MKILTYQLGDEAPKAGLLMPEGIVDIAEASVQIFPDGHLLPDNVLDLLTEDPGLEKLRSLADSLQDLVGAQINYQDPDLVTFLPPVLRPGALLDFYTFEQHVKTCRAKRGLDVVPEWYEYPSYYNGNPRALKGHGARVFFPEKEDRRDYELELAVVIGRAGRKIPEDVAHEYIAGYTIMNDWSARSIQAKVMKIGLGPAKGKDFATSLGPYLVTPDEVGDPRDLVMRARVNGEEWSHGISGSSHYTFAQMIAYASEDMTLYPGDVLGSGTVGTGCGLELDRFLQPGDVVELEIDKLGVLRNKVAP